MMTAEQWYEYQDNYKRYGLDMKPKAVNHAAAERNNEITIKEKIVMISFILLIGALCGLLIVSAAYSAGVKYDINNIIRENEQTVGEIENLKVTVKNTTNIRAVEEKAKNELGMIYPSSENFVFLTKIEKAQGEFAMIYSGD